MEFASIVETLLIEKKITKAKMLTDLSLGKNQFAYWKKNGVIPNGFTVQAIADYLGTSVDYLLGKTDQKEKTSVGNDPDESKMRKLYAAYSALSPERQHQLDDYIAFLQSQQGE